MNKKASIVIGRFQPVHKGHIELFRKATEDTDLLVVVLGSAERPADMKNPFSDHQRAAMIESAILDETDNTTSHNTPRFAVHFVSVHDYFYSDTRWLTELRDKVYSHIDGYDVTLFGHHRDDSSYYLDMFPEWQFEEVAETCDGLNATAIRDSIFQHGKVPEHALAHPVEQYINHWMTTTAYDNLKAEWHLVKKMNVKWASAPYPVSFDTADAIVIHKGHVLMIERGVHPGKGLLALPGGHLDVKKDRSLLDCAVRELQEETGVEVNKELVFNKNAIVFDAPNRSVRGRYITHAFMWVLSNYEDFDVKGGDDAAKAMWIPLNEIHRKYHLIFEDHAEIIESMVGKL